jgi:hypothetical protein
MAHPSSKLNSQVYVINASQTATTEYPHHFHTILCVDSGTVTVKGDLSETITGSSVGPATRSTRYVASGSYGYEQGLSGSLIEDDTELENSCTASGCTASQSGGTVAQENVTVTRGGVDISTDLGNDIPSFDGISTNASGDISAILPTSDVGANLEVGDVLTFDVHSGTVTLTLEADDIDLNAGTYQLAAGQSIAVSMVAGQTYTGRFTSVAVGTNTKVIAYKQ